MPKVLALRLAATDVDTDVLCRTLSRRLSAAVRTVSADHPLVLLRQARAMRKNVANCDVVHTFGTRPLACAIAAGATRIVHSLTRFPTSADTRWLRAAVQHRAIEIVCPTDTLRRALVTRGVPISRTHLVRPGVSLGDFQTQRDEKIRAALGFSPGDRVLFAPGDIRHNGISASMWAASLLAVIDERYKILVHARGENADAINRLSSR